MTGYNAYETIQSCWVEWMKCAMEEREFQCKYISLKDWGESVKTFQLKTESLLATHTEKGEDLAMHRIAFQAYLIKLLDEGEVTFV
jgi:hypothetical protein